MKRLNQFSVTIALASILGFATAACNTTPNERQEIAEREIDKLDERIENLADHTKREAQEAKEALQQRRTEAVARESRGTVAAKEQHMEQELLGDYRYLSQVSADSMKDAYVYFMQQVRSRKDVWSMEDWDYANAIYKRLNGQEQILHQDIILRHAAKIKALQAEYLALENKADFKDYRRVKKAQ